MPAARFVVDFRLMAADVPVLRLARLGEADAIDDLMKASTRAIFPGFYSAEESAASAELISSVDRTLIADGTYFVQDADGLLVACGGWSKRDKLYTGSGSGAADARLLDPASEPARIRAMFTRPDWTRRGLGRAILEACESAARADGFRSLALRATLPGVPLYESYGFRIVEEADVHMPDGTSIVCHNMVKPIS
jgi:GNAT superfamily N-acetyltransferase